MKCNRCSGRGKIRTNGPGLPGNEWEWIRCYVCTGTGVDPTTKDDDPDHEKLLETVVGPDSPMLLKNMGLGGKGGMGFTLEQILTPDEIQKAVTLKHIKHDTFEEWCVRDILKPDVVARISKELGQEMDVKYLAYAIRYILYQDPDTRTPLRQLTEELSEMALKMEDRMSYAWEIDPDGTLDEVKVEIEALVARIQELL